MPESPLYPKPGHSRVNAVGTIQLGRGETATSAFLDAQRDYLASLKTQKQSPETIDKRRNCLRKFFLYLDARGVERFADVDGKLLDEFRLCLVEHTYSASEIEATMRSVQFLFRHLAEQNLIFDDPARRMKIPKAPVSLGNVLTEREVQRLLAVPDLTKPRGLRDRALLEVLYSTGMRRGEAAGLTIHDVDLDRATVKVQGKGRKQRLIPLGKHAVTFLRLYLQEARPRLLPKFMPASNALWLDRGRKGMLAATICRTVKAYGRKADVTTDTHTMRRTCATQMLRGGAHPAVVAQILGHSDLGSLSHYLRTTITDLQKAHSLTNPGH